MELVTTGTRTALVFIVTLIVMVALYDTNLPVDSELLRKRSKAKVCMLVLARGVNV